MSLTPEEVARILDLLERSHFDTLEYEADGLRLIARRGVGPEPGVAPSAGQNPATPPSATPPETSENVPAPRVSAEPPPAVEEGSFAGDASDEAGSVVKAPTAGTFYRAPSPGADPFVKVGDTVVSEATLGLLEVMKMFTAVKAEIGGRIEKVLAEDGDFVEYGQALFVMAQAD